MFPRKASYVFLLFFPFFLFNPMVLNCLPSYGEREAHPLLTTVSALKPKE